MSRLCSLGWLHINVLAMGRYKVICFEMGIKFQKTFGQMDANASPFVKGPQSSV